MERIATVDAVGHVLCHDLTRIVRGVAKDAAFRKGHVVTQEDIPVLLSMGKEHLYVWECGEGMLHEDEAAGVLAALCQNKGMSATPVKEGKIELIAEADGLFCVDVARLDAVNALGDIIVATRHTNSPVKKGDKLAAGRVIPLVIAQERLRAAQKIAGERPLLELLPFRSLRAGIIATGNEVLKGRIADTFTPVVEQKLARFGVRTAMKKLCGDELEAISDAILEMLDAGMDMVLCTGGMSVDPDDLTPGAIRATGAEVVSYGAPVLPGAMFLMAYHKGRPVMGLPGCVMYAEATIFDLVLPRVAAGKTIRREELARLGHGGLCLGCAPCRYPDCGFGKGL